MMRKFFKKLVSPFEAHAAFLLLLFLLTSAVDVCAFCLRGTAPFAVYVVFANFFFCYVLVFLSGLLPRNGRRIIRWVLILAASAAFITDLFCNYYFHTTFNEEIAAIMLGTNPGEAKEFIGTFATPKFCLLAAGLLCLSGFACRLAARIKAPKVFGWTGFILTGIAAGLLFRNPSVWKNTFIGKTVTFFYTPQAPDLKDYYTHPVLERSAERQPDHIVVIMGESFSKSHSSLYGYSRTTNPHLSQLRDSACLYVYPHVESAATNTIASFQCMMSTYRPEYGDSVKWYACTILIELLQTAGYDTRWISNQSKTGIFDNVIGRYAELCDGNYFAGNKFSGTDRLNLDEDVLALTRPLAEEKPGKPRFYFVHLMGSHITFRKRYPARFDHFKADDYTAYPENQRVNRATYDNSVLYNDSVVAETIRLFEDKEAIVFYLSDHAIDLYDSSDDYAGHARTEDSLSVRAGTGIPFMVYVSPLFRQNFPECNERIKSSTCTPYRTDSLLYTVMDVAGIQAVNGKDITRRSLFYPRKRPTHPEK